MRKLEFINRIKELVFVVEMILAVILIIAIIGGFITSVQFVPQLFSVSQAKFYDTFKAFLGNALLLIIGVELIRMLITHTTRATLELMVFVITRKLLIYTDSMLDIFLGTVSLAIVIATIRFLLPKTKQTNLCPQGTLCPNATVKEINRRYGVNFPLPDDTTLGEIVASLRKKTGPYQEGEEIKAGPVNIVIRDVDSKGNILDMDINDSNFVNDDF